jgi:transposase InsO family protein
MDELKVSERRVCRALEVPRSTQRYAAQPPADEPRLAQDIVRLATEFGRYGYRRITELLRWDGWLVNHKRVERLWRQEGLKVPKRQPKRKRLWLADGSCVRLRPVRKNHVWSYDFVSGRTSDGKPLRFLNILDEFSRVCLSIDVDRHLTSEDVLCRLAELFILYGIPEYIRSDNGPEFIAKAVREWLGRLGVKTLYIEPGSPWENGYIESFNGKFRDEFLDREVLDTLLEARVLTARWRHEYNHFRPHSSLGYRPPAPEAFAPTPRGGERGLQRQQPQQQLQALEVGG